jgi:radical SAM superfamily enzyme YgiQ (UPF0313 family)
MTKKLLLIFPKLEEYKDYHYVPLSLLALAAPLEHYGVDYAIFDERVDEFERLYKLLEEVSYVGITLFTGYQTHRGYEILKIVREFNKGIRIIAGGPHVSELPRQMLESDLVDYVVIGYGEESFYLLLNELINKNRVDIKIDGIGFKDTDGKIVINPPVRKFSDGFWYNIPFNKVDLRKYINPKTKRVIYLTNYGCPGKCTFCASLNDIGRLAARPMEMIKEDLDELHRNYPFEEICFFDATLFCAKKRVFELLGYLKKYNPIRWIADSRATDILMYTNKELEDIKKAAGRLIRITIGVESGSRRIAEDIMNKGKNHLVKFKECIRKLSQVSIPVTSGLIFGTPGETIEDIKNTTEYIKEIRSIYPDFTLSTTFFRPLPGTQLYYSLKTTGFPLPESFKDWAKYSSKSHYKYNEWMDIPWVGEDEKRRYREQYDIFMEEHKDILV